MTSRSRESGFTLLEIIVVIAVLGLVMGVLSAYAPPRSRWPRMVAVGNQVAAAMRGARIAAIGSGRPVVLRMPKLPVWLEAAVDAPAGPIVFEPDGSASGGVVALRSGGRRVSVTADWLTGRISVDAQ